MLSVYFYNVWRPGKNVGFLLHLTEEKTNHHICFVCCLKETQTQTKEERFAVTSHWKQKMEHQKLLCHRPNSREKCSIQKDARPLHFRSRHRCRGRTSGSCNFLACHKQKQTHAPSEIITKCSQNLDYEECFWLSIKGCTHMTNSFLSASEKREKY